jgi:hypothetical protein
MLLACSDASVKTKIRKIRIPSQMAISGAQKYEVYLLPVVSCAVMQMLDKDNQRILLIKK